MMQMQPYRFPPLPITPHTCLDPPPPPCAPPPPRARPSIEIALIASFGIVAAVGGFTFHAVGHGGRVEIAPHALALVHHAKHPAPPREAKRPNAPATESELVAIRPWLGGSHDPAYLLAHAREMQGLGLDVTVIEIPFGKRVASSYASALWPTDSLPVYGYGHHVDALEVRKVPSDSLLRVAGVSDGDELLGVDGYRFDDDSFRNIDSLAIQKRGWVVVELGRGQHHVVLSIRWDTK